MIKRTKTLVGIHISRILPPEAVAEPAKFVWLGARGKTGVPEMNWSFWLTERLQAARELSWVGGLGGGGGGGGVGGGGVRGRFRAYAPAAVLGSLLIRRVRRWEVQQSYQKHLMGDDQRAVSSPDVAFVSGSVFLLRVPAIGGGGGGEENQHFGGAPSKTHSCCLCFSLSLRRSDEISQRACPRTPADSASRLRPSTDFDSQRLYNVNVVLGGCLTS